jgi:hypothetical protein
MDIPGSLHDVQDTNNGLDITSGKVIAAAESVYEEAQNEAKSSSSK